MKLLPLVVATGLLFGTAFLHADEPVTIEAAWVAAVPPTSNDTAAFGKVVNHTDQPLKLTGGKSAAAKEVVVMITTKTEKEGAEVLGMKTVPSLEVPAGGELVLEPGGDHIMVMGLLEPLLEGTKVAMTLQFEGDADPIEVEMPVKRMEEAACKSCQAAKNEE